jgi:predicted TIM-barrel fold metal-dependent hydrolase
MPEWADLDLIDHHCHGVVQRDLDEQAFEAMLTEASGPSARQLCTVGGSLLDSRIGLAVRRWCAPVLGLEPHTPAAEYLVRRAALGFEEVNARFLGAAGLSGLCVDTGYVPEPILTPAELGALASAPAYEIVRLEQIAESLFGSVDADGFAGAFQSLLESRTQDAVGVKSIAAYRTGLNLDPARPSEAEVANAAAHWLARDRRMADPVLQRFLIWSAVDRGLPIQFHVGLGDSDVDMCSCDPLLLMGLLREIEPSGVPVMLLHNYPFHRNAGYLAQVFSNVFVDVGLTTHNLGDRATAVIEETLELTPFGKFLYSSDAFGLPEFYYLSARLFRRGLASVVDTAVAEGSWSADDGERFVRLIATENAKRVYKLDSDVHA